jgi:hydrogenase maturation protease
MKPVLVLALGNPCAGDDGIGCAVAERISADAELAARADVVCAGTDLFRHARELAGRSRVIIVDAALGDGRELEVRAIPHPPPTSDRRSDAHALDPVGAVSLLRSLEPDIAAAEIWWLLIQVPQVALHAGLSPEAADRLPEAAAEVRRLVLDSPRPA